MSEQNNTSRGPSRLSAALLARKGSASPAGFAPVPFRAKTPGNCASAPHAIDARVLATQTSHDDCPSARVRLTIRLNETRHMRIKLASAHLKRSLQDIMTEAVDRYLDQVAPEMLSSNCVCLANRVRGASD